MKHAAVTLFAVLMGGAALGATVDVVVGPVLSFSPPSVNISQGDTVRWVWQGALHTSTSDATTGPEVWNSGLMSSGTFSHPFNTVGDWPYYCSLHSSPGGTAMNGVVHVAAAAPAATPALSAALLLLLIVILGIAGVVALRN
jgi:plastocyanin